MDKFSKLIILGLAIAMIGNTFIGCGKKEMVEKHVEQADVIVKIEKESAIEQQQPIRIRTVSPFGGIDPAAEIYGEKLDEFKNENPNITVEDESGLASQGWKAKIATDFIVGNEPDVIYTFTGKDVKSMIEQGQVVSIKEIRQEYPQYASNILENILEIVEEFDGKAYAVPVSGHYEGLFVNKAIFEEYGLELPTDWEKFESAIIALNEKGKVPIAAALGHMPHHWIEHLVLSQGGIETHENVDITAVKKYWIKGLEYLKSLYELGAFPIDTNIISNERTIELFASGDAAMLLETSKIISQFENLDDIVILPFPTVPGGKKDPSDILGEFTSGWYITQKAWDDPAKRSVAVKFVEKMTSTDAIGDFAKLGGTPTADVGEGKGLLSIEISGFEILAGAKNMYKPMDVWLSKPAWEKLVSQIPDIATGKEGARAIVDGVIILN